MVLKQSHILFHDKYTSLEVVGVLSLPPRHVMIAAHCGPGMFRSVIVGEHLSYNDSDGIIHETCRYENHLEYVPTSKHGGDFLAGKLLTTSGWGATLNETHAPSRLRFVKVPGVTNLECKKWFNENDYLPWKVQIRPAELCAGEPDAGGKDACQGDSGGNI